MTGLKAGWGRTESNSFTVLGSNPPYLLPSSPCLEKNPGHSHVMKDGAEEECTIVHPSKMAPWPLNLDVDCYPLPYNI